MKITMLVENTSISPEYKKKHGLCMHIQTANHSILFDLGPDDSFIKNAKKLNVDIKSVDKVIISHGHKDHGGGLKYFLEVNDTAKIYVNKNAFNKHIGKIIKIFKVNVGLDDSLKTNPRLVFLDDLYNIDEHLVIFNKIKSKKFIPNGNKSLFKKHKNKYVEDDFNHEHNLVIKENDKNYLFAGCSHNGIINILDKAEESVRGNIDYVIAGFHLYNTAAKRYEDAEFISSLGDYLEAKDCKYFTCHCTGVKAFEQLKELLEDKISYFKTGQVIEI